jgi:hypothetical protein
MELLEQHYYVPLFVSGLCKWVSFSDFTYRVATVDEAITCAPKYFADEPRTHQRFQTRHISGFSVQVGDWLSSGSATR